MWQAQSPATTGALKALAARAPLPLTQTYLNMLATSDGGKGGLNGGEHTEAAPLQADNAIVLAPSFDEFRNLIESPSQQVSFMFTPLTFSA